MNNRQVRFHKARNYVLYYGKGNSGKMAGYDIAIIEPSAQTAKDIAMLKDMNTLVIGYVSMMELAPFHNMYSMVMEEDFLKVNGEKMYKSEYDTYLLNLKSKRWQGLLFHHIGKLLLHDGYDGIFMDTIGDVEAPILPEVERNTQVDQASEIVGRLRELFPGHLLIQNNGLERLFLKTAEHIDGICWENPIFTYQESHEWCQFVLGRLIDMQKKHKTRAFLLHENNQIRLAPSAGITAQAIADKHEFLYYEAAQNYLAIP